MTKHSLHIRLLQEGDEIALERLFFYSIRKVSSRDYNQEQIAAWAPENRDMAEWDKSFKNKTVFVAELERVIVGFAELEESGHIDRFYCSADHQGMGIGRRLLGELEKTALEKGIKRLFVEASITAKPFFEKFDYKIITAQIVTLREVEFTNFRMDKKLLPVQQWEL